MKNLNVALLVELGEIFTEDFILMAILVICMCWPIIAIVLWGIYNYRKIGRIFPSKPAQRITSEEVENEEQQKNRFPSPDPTLDNK